MGRLAIAAALAWAVSGCKGGAMDEGDRFAPGTWHLEAWMESEAGSTRGVAGATLTDVVKLTPEQAMAPPAAVFFRHFYHGANNPDVRFADGRVEGSFHQGRVDDISAHDVPISGSYARDHFRVTFGYKAFGMTINQVAEGKLVEPAA